jgi:hypothetical protein
MDDKEVQVDSSQPQHVGHIIRRHRIAQRGHTTSAIHYHAHLYRQPPACRPCEDQNRGQETTEQCQRCPNTNQATTDSAALTTGKRIRRSLVNAVLSTITVYARACQHRRAHTNHDVVLDVLRRWAQHWCDHTLMPSHDTHPDLSNDPSGPHVPSFTPVLVLHPSHHQSPIALRLPVPLCLHPFFRLPLRPTHRLRPSQLLETVLLP